jgi:predicted small lipoprotein YifL
MQKTLLLLTTMLCLGLTACGQTGALLLPSGEPPTPGNAGQVAAPADEDAEKKAEPDGG